MSQKIQSQNKSKVINRAEVVDQNHNFHDAYPSSFFPEILAVLQSNQIDATFIHINRRSDLINSDPDPYLEDITRFTETNDLHLIDFSKEPVFDKSWFAGGDHIKAAKRKDFTLLFYERTKGLFK